MEHNTKYPKTRQYRQAVRTLKESLSYIGKGRDDQPVYDESLAVPTVYEGTVKVHGTNAGIILHSSGEITLHSRQDQLAVLNRDCSLKTMVKDNSGFVEGVLQNKAEFQVLVDYCIYLGCGTTYPIEIYGEWAGPGVQGGVGVSQLPRKMFFMFTLKVAGRWYKPPKLGAWPFEDATVHSVSDFPMPRIVIDPLMPEEAIPEMERLVTQVEERRPVASHLLKNSTENTELVGEGLVWTPIDPKLYSNRGLWFKTRGEKHSVTKVNRLVTVDPEKIANIREFVDYAVTENRLKQGLEHVEAKVENTGDFIGWINRDILAEESDTLRANNLTMKEVGKYTATKARKFFMENIS